MKKIVIFCLMTLMGMGVCAAQKAGVEKKEVTAVFTTDIDCDHCVKKIMNNVGVFGKGIKDLQVDLKTKEVTIVFDNTKNNMHTLLKGFASLKVKAEPKACPESGCAKKSCGDQACGNKADTQKKACGESCGDKACAAKK